jgi:hypothetical protein
MKLGTDMPGSERKKPIDIEEKINISLHFDTLSKF